MTYCYYQGKPTVVPLHACYWYCYITGSLTRSTYILTQFSPWIGLRQIKTLKFSRYVIANACIVQVLVSFNVEQDFDT